MIILPILFFITAILYSSVGFGGGSTYLALLLIWDIPYYIFPVVALVCNIIVVSGNSINYIRAGNHNFKLLIPFLIGSVPFAFFGGTLKIDKEIFEIILFFVLSIAGTLLLINNKSYQNNNLVIKKISSFINLVIGSVLGFVSGIVGIGGGIFLSPILFLIKAEKPKVITTTASLFILINSISGILGQLTKENVLTELPNYLSLFICVLLGGLIGNYLNLKIFTGRVLAILTSVLVIFVSIRMGYKILF
ncbi:sulfite exporter TauE/SafE family protein [Candidatus Pelagibacter sp. HIMB1483]|uniref:sulfite exporter TauE/SafE family protein n=1 Tax=Candidatus Pelagibacter sp. HIMB1483 TaxID=3415414 RepID=UPI003F86773A